MSEIVDNFDMALNKSSDYLFYMYSAHDVTIGYVLVGLNLTTWGC
jgi:hypothetical protein